MYSPYYSSSLFSIGSVMTFIIYLIAIIAIAVWIIAIASFIKLAKSKGYNAKNNLIKLWLIGIFASPLVLGLYILMLPENSACSSSQVDQAPVTPEASTESEA